MTVNEEKPKLRAVDIQPFVDKEQALLMLRDPLGLSDKTVVMPQALGPLLALFDGSLDQDGLQAALLVRAGMRIPPDIIRQVIDHLDDALLLDNQRFAAAYRQAVADYREAPFRPPRLAGNSYPEDPGELRELLDGYLRQASNGEEEGQAPDKVLGLVSPHIDYQRGGAVYAQVWDRAGQAVREADLVVIFGTDHASERSLMTLTRQDYATPYGVLPTDQALVDLLAGVIGEEEAFAEEMHHLGEHSIELAAVWLHHLRDGQPCRLLPILCGSFQPFITAEADPALNDSLQEALQALQEATAGQRVLLVAAADLAHVGPAFSDPYQIDYVRYLRLESQDEAMIRTMTANDATAFFRMIADEENRRNVCGLAPIYMTMQMLNGKVAGELTGYDRCPADAQNTSFVSICGMVFYE